MAPGEVRVAVVGAGYFGSIHCSKLARLQGARLAAVVDLRPERARQAAGAHRAQALPDIERLPGLADAAVVAVPTSRHFQVARRLCELGLHLLVEKPLAASYAHCLELCELAGRRGVMLQVGHLERFNPLWQELLRHTRRPRQVEIVRRGPFPGRGGDVDVVREVMVHDLDMLLRLAGGEPAAVQARGRSAVTEHLDEVEARIDFTGGPTARVLASRCSAEAERRVVVTDAAGRLELDLLARRLVRHRPRGERQVLAVPAEIDPLHQQDRAFVAALLDGQRPVVSGQDGARAVALAERIHNTACRESS